MAGLEGTKTDKQSLFGDIKLRKGLDGKDGKSAYEIACDHGFVGTEEEWILSLQPDPYKLNKKHVTDALGYVPADEKVVKELFIEVGNATNGLKETASGELIVVNDSAEAKVSGLAIDGKSEQDGEPTPDNPIEIRNIGVYDEASGKYAVEVKWTRKNLISCEPSQSKTTNGITFKPNGKGGTHLSGTSNNSWAQNPKEYYPSIMLPKGTYTVSIKCDDKNVSAMVCKNGSNLKRTNVDSPYILTLDENAKIEFFLFVEKNGTTVDCDAYVQIEHGTVSTDYEPWSEPITATVYLDEPLRKGDKAYWNGGSKLRIDRYVDTIEFDGSETWLEQVYTDGVSRYFYVLKENVGTSQKSDGWGVCSHFLRTTDGNPKEGYFILGNAYTVKINSGIGSISEWKTWLAENHVLLEYERATPITEEIDIDLGELSMFYPTTIISNDCNANMEVTYIADTKAYIDKKFAELATAMV